MLVVDTNVFKGLITELTSVQLQVKALEEVVKSIPVASSRKSRHFSESDERIAESNRSPITRKVKDHAEAMKIAEEAANARG